MIVRRGLLVVKDGAQLGQMARPEQMRDIMHRREGEIAERLRRNLQHLAPARLDHLDTVRRQLAIDRKSVVSGKSVSVSVDLGGRRIIKNNRNKDHKII